jgi:hypothetical protein
LVIQPEQASLRSRARARSLRTTVGLRLRTPVFYSIKFLPMVCEAKNYW